MQELFGEQTWELASYRAEAICLLHIEKPKKFKRCWAGTPLLRYYRCVSTQEWCRSDVAYHRCINLSSHLGLNQVSVGMYQARRSYSSRGPPCLDEPVVAAAATTVLQIQVLTLQERRAHAPNPAVVDHAVPVYRF